MRHPGGIQGQAEEVSEQSGLVGGVPVYSRSFKLGDPALFQPKTFYNSVISHRRRISQMDMCMTYVSTKRLTMTKL